MITLYTFGPLFGLPDPSPFVTKADVLLKMSGVSYRCVPSGLHGAPKGKLPFIDDGAVKLGDSTFIRLHLEQRHGVNFDVHLTREQQGMAWACEKMLEDNAMQAARQPGGVQRADAAAVLSGAVDEGPLESSAFQTAQLHPAPG